MPISSDRGVWADPEGNGEPQKVVGRRGAKFFIYVFTVPLGLPSGEWTIAGLRGRMATKGEKSNGVGAWLEGSPRSGQGQDGSSGGRYTVREGPVGAS